MRLATNPSHTPTVTHTLPMRRPNASTAPSVRGAVRAPRTTSSRRITLAGLKKWVPTTSCGRRVAAAIASTSSVDVLVARTAPGRTMLSSWRKIACLIARSSKAASTTTSASAAACMSLAGEIRATASRAAASVMRPRAASDR
ncbi:Uncharacterised protein [Bordetella pertussis]|nr:Uncharacterised protein [Bordetella pertussis]